MKKVSASRRAYRLWVAWPFLVGFVLVILAGSVGLDRAGIPDSQVDFVRFAILVPYVFLGAFLAQVLGTRVEWRLNLANSDSVTIDVVQRVALPTGGRYLVLVNGQEQLRQSRNWMGETDRLNFSLTGERSHHAVVTVQGILSPFIPAHLSLDVDGEQVVDM